VRETNVMRCFEYLNLLIRIRKERRVGNSFEKDKRGTRGAGHEERRHRREKCSHAKWN